MLITKVTDMAQEGVDIHLKNSTGCQSAELCCMLHMAVSDMRENCKRNINRVITKPSLDHPTVLVIRILA
jgi:hypothetical protein